MSSCSCARTKRPWLFDAESIKWPTISFGDHLPGAGRAAASASDSARRRSAERSTVWRKSARKAASIRFETLIQSAPWDARSFSCCWPAIRPRSRPPRLLTRRSSWRRSRRARALQSARRRTSPTAPATTTSRRSRRTARGILFTSIRGGGTQTDIYRYDVASGSHVASDDDGGERVLADGDAGRRAHLGHPGRGRRHAAAVALHDGRARPRARADQRQAGWLPRMGRRSHARALRPRIAGDAADRRHAQPEPPRFSRAASTDRSSGSPAAARSASSRGAAPRRTPRCRFRRSIRRRSASPRW